MTDVVRDAIATELADVERVASTPVAPFGYGSDLSCTSDLTDGMVEVEGFVVLGEALARRLDCPRGALPDDGTFGLSLSEYLNTGTTALELRELGSKVRGELKKDDRVATVRVTVTPSPTGQSMAVQIVVVPVDQTIGKFALTLGVTSSGVVLQAIARAF